MKTKYAALMLCVLCLCAFTFGCSTAEKGDTTSTKTTVTEAETATAAESVAQSLLSTPDESGAIVSTIEGYNSNSAAQGGTVLSNAVTLPYTVEGTGLKITAMGGYSGKFVEDSSDQEVQGVFAIVVQNTGDSPLKTAKIVMTDENGNEYIFKLSTLPEGTSAIVMEEERQSYSPDINLLSIEASESFLDALSLNEDKISLSFDGENLKIKNISETDLTAVYVRYKSFTCGNVYLGGITYSTSFKNVEAGAEQTVSTAHLSLSESHILMVEVIE